MTVFFLKLLLSLNEMKDRQPVRSLLYNCFFEWMEGSVKACSPRSVTAVARVVQNLVTVVKVVKRRDAASAANATDVSIYLYLRNFKTD